MSRNPKWKRNLKTTRVGWRRGALIRWIDRAFARDPEGMRKLYGKWVC